MKYNHNHFFIIIYFLLLLQGYIECVCTMIADKEHLFNSNILFCLPCTLYTLILMSHWLSSFPPASDLIIMSIALFKKRHYHLIILFPRLYMYHCFSMLCFAVSVFWQFCVASCLNISNFCSILHLKIKDILTLWLSDTSWAQQTSAHLGWRHSTIPIGVPHLEL